MSDGKTLTAEKGLVSKATLAFMADVYGRLTGRAGTWMAMLGPGATNLITRSCRCEHGSHADRRNRRAGRHDALAQGLPGVAGDKGPRERRPAGHWPCPQKNRLTRNVGRTTVRFISRATIHQ